PFQIDIDDRVVVQCITKTITSKRTWEWICYSRNVRIHPRIGIYRSAFQVSTHRRRRVVASRTVSQKRKREEFALLYVACSLKCSAAKMRRLRFLLLIKIQSWMQ
ncbi:MAG: hypothetical protein ACI90V_008583, partial [Bacillariaceae sp.]